jgi:hypothetical protein
MAEHYIRELAAGLVEEISALALAGAGQMTQGGEGMSHILYFCGIGHGG